MGVGYHDLGKPVVSVIGGLMCSAPLFSEDTELCLSPSTPEHFKLFRFREPRLIPTVNYLTFRGAATLYLGLALASTPPLVSR